MPAGASRVVDGQLQHACCLAFLLDGRHTNMPRRFSTTYTTTQLPDTQPHCNPTIGHKEMLSDFSLGGPIPWLLTCCQGSCGPLSSDWT